MSEVKLVCCYMVHSDYWFFENSLSSFKGPWPTYVFISRYPWGGRPGDTGPTREIAERCGATVIEGIWITEDEQRCFVLAWCLQNGFTHAFLPDSDEIIELQLLSNLVKFAEAELGDRFYVEWDTYFGSPEYVVRPRERFNPLIVVDVRAVHHVHLRNYEGGRPIFLNDTYGKIHHCSYCGNDARIYTKINSWGHKHQVVPGYFENKFKAWKADKTTRNLNPVDPAAYGFTERIAVPEILQAAFAKCQVDTNEKREEIAPCPNWSKPSVVIALCNGKEDIEKCLDHLDLIRDLLGEVIVVDNGSDEEVLEAVRTRDVNLIELGSNKGFAYANNRGIEAAKGDSVLLLNSDCFLTRAGTVAMGNTLTSSATIAAVGPYTNRAGHGQQIEPTYTSLENLERFAEDFAARSEPNVDTDMLVGFCIWIKKSVIDEVGLLSEKFGLGTYEDNEFCYRCRRANFRLVLSGDSFAHHEGSRTLLRLGIDTAALLEQNRQIFIDMWKQDLEVGFSDSLSGLRAAPIKFNYSRKPEALIEHYRQKAKRARLSACLIVKDEARCIEECIESLLPFCFEIVVNDTGSTDRTMEILRKYPVKLVENPWEKSFSIGRNQSIDEASGDFILWPDADDVLPLVSGMELIDALLTLPPDVGGVQMQIRYAENSRSPGLRVDHLKVFRNRPDYRFENRIHEQILTKIRASGLRDMRINAYILHKNYDESSEGQRLKRVRDEPILFLDLSETPESGFKMFNIAMSYHHWGEHETAIPWFEKCLAHSTANESQVAPAYSLWAASLNILGKKKEALAKAKEGIAAAPGYAELHFRAGLWSLELENYQEARNNFRKCVGADMSMHLASMDYDILGFKSMRYLAAAEMGLGHYGVAKDWWQKTLTAQPGDLGSAHDFAKAAIRAKDFPTVNAVLDHVLRHDGYNPIWAHISLDYQDAIMGPNGGFSFLTALLERNPGYHGVRHALAIRLIEANRPNDAVPHLMVLDQHNIQPGAHHMGKLCMLSGDFKGALGWMERAHRLDPAQLETNELLDKLRRSVEQSA